MKEYEVVCKYLNGCAGEAYPLTHFEEVELEDPADYIRQKHGRDFERFVMERTEEGVIRFTLHTGVTYIYEFTEL
ncbi:MAG: hypothetical protein ACI3V3_04545 [Faecousia sp.]